MDKNTFNVQNQEQWQKIEDLFCNEPGKPSLIWVTTNTLELLHKYYQICGQTLVEWEHSELDLSVEHIESLHKTLTRILPNEVKKGTDKQHIVHIFGMENSVGPLGITRLIHTLNIERESLFRDYNCVIMIWTDEILTKKVMKYAFDFWKLASKNHFSFKKNLPEISLKEEKPTVLFLYIDEDFDFKKKLAEELDKIEKSVYNLNFHFINVSNGYMFYKDEYKIIMPILSPSSIVRIPNLLKELPSHHGATIVPILWKKVIWQQGYFKNSPILPSNLEFIAQKTTLERTKIIKLIIDDILDFEEDISAKFQKDENLDIPSAGCFLPFCVFAIPAILVYFKWIYTAIIVFAILAYFWYFLRKAFKKMTRLRIRNLHPQKITPLLYIMPEKVDDDTDGD
jgi:hypothetical protein